MTKISNQKENTKPHLNVVFLDINRHNEELKFLERNSMWGHRIQFIHGSVLVSIKWKLCSDVCNIYKFILKDEQTLKRVVIMNILNMLESIDFLLQQARSASAIFTLSGFYKV